MNLEEAKENIGKEVVYVGNDKNLLDDVFKGKKLIISEPTRSREQNVLIEYDDIYFWVINPLHIKLKEQLMQNYKIKVTPETIEEVQKLFFELGYIWHIKGRKISYKEKPYLFAESDGYIKYDYNKNFFNSTKNQEITLSQLRDLAVLKRNDVNDATHAVFATKYYFGYDVCEWKESRWHKSDFEKQTIKVGGCSLKSETEMTWEEALQHFLAGRNVEMLDSHNQWEDMKEFYLHDIATNGNKFRLKPKTIYIDGGDYTRHELIKIAGEIE